MLLIFPSATSFLCFRARSFNSSFLAEYGVASYDCFCRGEGRSRIHGSISVQGRVLGAIP